MATALSKGSGKPEPLLVFGGTKKISSFLCQRLDIPGGMCYFFADQMVNENLGTYLFDQGEEIP